MNLKRFGSVIALRCVTHIPIPNSLRVLCTKWGGVQLTDNQCFIGDGVIFDSLYPDRIEIGKHVHITMRCILLTHVLDTSYPGIKWKKGYIRIKDNAFIGANTIICNSVTIGENSIVGAGSVVTKDIPDNEIWAGNPAKFIKKRVKNIL